jgi:hypothetical protein
LSDIKKAECELRFFFHIVKWSHSGHRSAPWPAKKEKYPVSVDDHLFSGF